MHRVFKRRRHLVLLPQRSSLYRATTSLHFILLNYFIGIKAALYKSVDLLSSSGSELNGLGGSFQLQQQQTKKLQLTATLVELYTVYTQYVLHTQMLCYSVGVGIVECYAMLCQQQHSPIMLLTTLLCTRRRSSVRPRSPGHHGLQYLHCRRRRASSHRRRLLVLLLLLLLLLVKQRETQCGKAAAAFLLLSSCSSDAFAASEVTVAVDVQWLSYLCLAGILYLMASAPSINSTI